MAFDVFCKIDGIEGESTDDVHGGEIELLSYTHGLSQSAGISRSSTGSATAERCDHQDFVITKNVDKATPPLNLHCCNGKHIPEVTVTLCRSGEDKIDYMKYIMSDVIVTSISPSGSSGDAGLPVESVTFNYGQIKWEYQQTDSATGAPSGVVQSGWNVEKNVKI